MAPTAAPRTWSRLIPATNLSPDTFAPFGEVVQNPRTHNGVPKDVKNVKANQGTATKWLDITHMRNFYDRAGSGGKGESVVNMFVCEPRRLEKRVGSDGTEDLLFPLRILERHPFTPQTFIPMGVSANDENVRYLIVVAPTLPTSSATPRDSSDLRPPYPVPSPLRRKRSLKERLLGARPNPYTNGYSPSTTPSPTFAGPVPKGPGMPDLVNVKAFVAKGDQGVTYGPGTWHAPMVVLGSKPIDFVVVQYANGVAPEDCQEVEIGVSDGGEGIAVDVGGLDGLKARL